MDLAKPAGVELIVSGTDVQGAYLATLVAGFSRQREMWCLDYFETPGDVRDAVTLPNLIADLASAGVHRAGVDSGYATDAVYAATRGRRGVVPTKGELGNPGDPVVLPTPHNDRRGHYRGARALRINTSGAKDELFAMLQVAEPGRNFVHVPKRLGAPFLAQLTSEERVPRLDPAGVEIGSRWKIKTLGVRNEALDCAVIALALFHSTTPTSWAAVLSKPNDPAPPSRASRSSYLGGHQ